MIHSRHRSWLQLPLLYFPLPRRSITTSTTIAKGSQLPKLIITPGSAHHNSLPTFLEYAKRVNLSPTKTVYVGTHYEYIVALSLLRLGFSLLRTGRSADQGIDLIGHWTLPPVPAPLPVIVQCKFRSAPLSPQHVRELEGAFQGIPAEWRRKDVFALLVTTKKATKGVMDALSQSRWPMAFLKISRTGVVEQFLWNHNASERGLEGVGVTVRHTPRKLLDEEEKEMEEEEEEAEESGVPKKRSKKLEKWKDTGTRKDILLTWMGEPMFPDRSELHDETLKLGQEIASEKVDLIGEEELAKKAALKAATDKRSSKSTKGASGKAVTKRSSRIVKHTPKNNADGNMSTIRGRPKGAQTKTAVSGEVAVVPPQKRGRPKGSKNKTSMTAEPTSLAKLRLRNH